jgi:protein HOOK3
MSMLTSIPQTCLTTVSRDDHYYQVQSEKRQILTEKDSIEKAYQTLMQEHRTLQANVEDLTSERDEALARVREIQRGVDDRRHDKADMMLKAELDHLRTDL